MELNKNIEVFVLDDWAGNELGRFDTLDELEDKIDEMVATDEEVELAKTYLQMIEYHIGDEEAIDSAYKAIEELEEMAREELYVYGLDKEENRADIQFG